MCVAWLLVERLLHSDAEKLALDHRLRCAAAGEDTTLLNFCLQQLLVCTAQGTRSLDRWHGIAD